MNFKLTHCGLAVAIPSSKDCLTNHSFWDINFRIFLKIADKSKIIYSFLWKNQNHMCSCTFSTSSFLSRFSKNIDNGSCIFLKVISVLWNIICPDHTIILLIWGFNFYSLFLSNDYCPTAHRSKQNKLWRALSTANVERIVRLVNSVIVRNYL